MIREFRNSIGVSNFANPSGIRKRERMQVINLRTQKVFDLPQEKAEELVNENPQEFGKIVNNTIIVKKSREYKGDGNILKYILDDT